MVDIPSAAVTASQTATQTAQAASNLTPVTATASALPDQIQQLIRQIQLTGTISQPPDAGKLVISTVLGDLTLLLPQLAEAKQDQLLQQLLNIFQTQKPVTVAVQPGNPPTQAILLLPPASTAAAETPNINLASQAIQVKLMPVVPGASLPAIVLPPDISLSPGTTSQPQTVTFPQTYAPPTYSATLPPPSSPLATLLPETNVAGPSITSLISDELAAPSLLKSGQLALQPLPVTPQPSFINAPVGAPAVTSTALPPLQTSATPLPATPVLPNLPGPNPAITAPPTSTQILPPGSEAVVRIVSVALPDQPPPVAQTPDQILAKVVATGLNGEPVVKAGDTILFIRQSEPLPPGTTLLVTLAPLKMSPMMPILPPDAQNALNVQQLMSALAQISPQLAQQVMNTSMPQANAMLPATLLFLLGAFKQGSVRDWLGSDASDSLTHAGKAELIARITQDLDAAAMPTRDPVVGEWHSYPIPFYNQGQFQVMNFHVHSDSGRDKEKDGSGKTRPSYIRFLIDMRLSRLGPMQLDGFVRPKQLDLVIRSEHSLPEGTHQELRLLYTRTLGVIDYAGSLNFQAGRQGWLHVQKTASKAVVT